MTGRNLAISIFSFLIVNSFWAGSVVHDEWFFATFISSILLAILTVPVIHDYWHDPISLLPRSGKVLASLVCLITFNASLWAAITFNTSWAILTGVSVLGLAFMSFIQIKDTWND